MPTYTTRANVQLELPSTLPSGFVASYMTDMIAYASAMADAMVGPDYPFSYESNVQKFPNMNDTPSIIEKCARLIAAAEGYVRLKEINKLSGKDMETKLRRQAEKKLLAIRDGEYQVAIDGVSLRSTKIDHVTDQHIYKSDETDPIFNRESLDSRW